VRGGRHGEETGGVAGHPGATYEGLARKSEGESLFDRRGQLDFVDVAPVVPRLVRRRACRDRAVLPVDNGWAVKPRG
jgi:hypothetical protein